jgi:hypothetical protein
MDDISDFHHSLNDMYYTMVEGSPCILLNPTNSSQVVGYLRNDAREAFQDNEALSSRSMIMLGPHYFYIYSRSNDYINTKTLSQNTFQGNFNVWSSSTMLLSYELPTSIL